LRAWVLAGLLSSMRHSRPNHPAADEAGIPPWLAAIGFLFLVLIVICRLVGNPEKSRMSSDAIGFLGYENRADGRYGLFQITNTSDRLVECLVPSGSAVWMGTDWRFQSPHYSWKGPGIQRKVLQPGETFDFFVPLPPSSARWRPWVFYRARGGPLLALTQELPRRLHLRIETRLDGPVFFP
jgi:hypothetical protein